MNAYYVVTWDFQLDETDEIVKDGTVFTDLPSAQNVYSEVLFASIDADFSTRSKPRLSKRIGKSGYITGETSIRKVESVDLVGALQEAFSGRGKVVNGN
jgi:hypothetical protein